MLINDLKKWLNDCIETAESRGLSNAEILFVFAEVLRQISIKVVLEQKRDQTKQENS